MTDTIGKRNDSADKIGGNRAGIGKVLDGVDRRGFLKCMAWAGAGLVWTLREGVPAPHALGRAKNDNQQVDFSFIQISDSHIGFNKPANTDVTATLQAALDKISAGPALPGLSHSHRRFDT